MPDIFISHARGDRKRVAAIAAALEADGFEVAWDDTVRGEDARRALSAARCVIVCWSRASARSEAALREATQAYNQRKLAPAMLQAVTPPLPFNMVESADLTQWRGDANDAAWAALLQDVRALAGGGTAGLGRATPAPITPYAPEEAPLAIERRPRVNAFGAPLARWALGLCVLAAALAGLLWAGPKFAHVTFNAQAFPPIVFSRTTPAQAQAAPPAGAAETGEPASAPER